MVKLDPAGTTLIYSTYLGGLGDEHIDALALDAAGYIYLTGSTNSKDFPITPGAVQKTFAGGSKDGDAFVAKLNPTGTALAFSTYLGGSVDDYGDAIAIDASGNVYITGSTASPDFPVSAGAFQATCGTAAACNNAAGDAFITKIDTVTGVPATIVPVSGNNQSGVPGAQLPKALVVQVLDARQGSVAGAVVGFVGSTQALILRPQQRMRAATPRRSSHSDLRPERPLYGRVLALLGDVLVHRRRQCGPGRQRRGERRQLCSGRHCRR